MNADAARKEFRALMERLEPEPEHTGHVAALALRLFDELTPLHGLSMRERLILEGAACLHDVGWTVAQRGAGHHKHSARLIRKHPWKEWNRLEVELLAQVARYHRRAPPSKEHTDFIALNQEQREIVRRLASLLRLADAFDRSHLQIVRDLRARILSSGVEITLVCRESPAREIAGALKKENLARQVFGRAIVYRYEIISLKPPPPTPA